MLLLDRWIDYQGLAGLSKFMIILLFSLVNHIHFRHRLGARGLKCIGGQLNVDCFLYLLVFFIVFSQSLLYVLLTLLHEIYVLCKLIFIQFMNIWLAIFICEFGTLNLIW